MCRTMDEPLTYRFGNWRLLPGQRLLELDGQPVKLGGRAFDMLLALVEQRHRVLNKHELMDLVWPRLVVEENNLQVQMVALRKLLGHPAIATVPGRGYRFTLPVHVEGDVARPAQSTAATADDRRPRPSNLPVHRPELIGRGDDLRAVLGLLEQHALVTIAGAAGIGKTRLAQAAAAAQVDAWPDGVWWVDLSALSDPTRIEEAVAQAMTFGTRAGTDAVSALWAALPAQAALLVLDNAEHLLQGVAPFAARVLNDAPRMRLLVTSQEVLRIAGEQVFRPEPLALPDGDDPAVIASSAAVALFVARAQAVSRHFVLDEGNRVAVADICRRLDGIPLAIELAAARAPLLGVEGLRDRLDQRLHVLIGGQRTSLRRHQTLRAALDWSCQLLSPHEQAVLRRLSVFVGGFTVEAAQQVAEDDEAIDRWDVLEHLGALVDKSLVMVEGEPLPRYRLLESTRLFALERLIDSGETAGVRSRHLEHFLALAETAREQMLVADSRGLGRLDLERDNLLLALAWRPDDGDATPTLRLVAALRLYWTSRGMLARGLETAQAALAHARARAGAQAREQPASAAECQVLAEVGFLQSMKGDQQAALSAAEAAVSMARGLGDPALLCRVLSSAGLVHLRCGQRDPARTCSDEAMALTGAIGDRPELANAMSLRSLVLKESGDTAQAMRWQQEVLALRQRLGHLWSQAVAHLELASMALDGGAPETALPHLRQTLALLPRVDSEYIGVFLLDTTATWAAAAGLDEDCLKLEAACTRQMRRAGIDRTTDRKRQAHIDRVRAAVDEETRARLQRDGGALSYADALGWAARLLSAAGGGHRSVAQS
jgi:predicted ATPase/DNA-binding winged helix-turn-helix (wHTH) protein